MLINEETIMRRKIHVSGVPWDEKSSFMRGCADAPNKIWDAFNCESANRCSENGHDLGMDDDFLFEGNMKLSSGNNAIDEIAAHASRIVSEGIFPLFLGGDHAVTYPLVKGLSDKYKNLSILHFDAHPDLYDEFDGDKYYHSCPRYQPNPVRRCQKSYRYRTFCLPGS